MVGVDKPVKPPGSAIEGPGLEPLLQEFHAAMLEQAGELPDLTGAEKHLTAADWRALEDSRRHLADKLGWAGRPFPTATAAGAQRPIPEETRAMSMAREETSVRPGGPRPGKDVYHSTCEPSLTPAPSGDVAEASLQVEPAVKAALAAYQRALEDKRIGSFRLLRLLGQGGQGKVFLCRYGGADGFSRVVALKLFSPEAYPRLDSYQQAMRRIARVTTRVAGEPHDHVVDVQRFLKLDQVRIMLMERVKGFDLRRLLHTRMLERFHQYAPPGDWERTNKTVITAGPEQARILPGAAVTLIRDCLNGLRALHSMGVVHGDLRPANLMVQPDGSMKIIDLGSAVVQGEAPRECVYTAAYAAPEVLERKDWTRQSDLASLGYVLLEMLIGRRLFKPTLSTEELLAEKRSLPHRVRELLPPPFVGSRVLVEFCRRLIAVEPQQRFDSAEQADVNPDHGAFAFLQELARGKMDAHWKNDIILWLKYLQPPRHAAPAGS